jgi:hypothetical protein
MFTALKMHLGWHSRVVILFYRYNPRDPTMNSETFHYKRGANQQFTQVSHVFDPSKFVEDDLVYNPEKDVIPIAIHCVAEEGSEGTRQAFSFLYLFPQCY